MKIFYFVFVLITTGLLFGCQTEQSVAHKKSYKEFVHSGFTLPLTSIVDLDGNQIDLTNSKKRKLVILFASWCPDSQRALNALNQSAILEDQSIEIVAIAREQKADVVKLWRDKNKIKIPLAVDPDRSIYKRFAEAGIPRFITVSENNKVIKMNLAEGENQLDKIQWHNPQLKVR